MKVDLAVQSYKKPEQLIYALFNLHSVSKNLVDTVWINDDQSGSNEISKYMDLASSGSLAPWKINIRVNKSRMGWWLAFVKGRRPKYQSNWFRLTRFFWNLWKTKSFFVDEEDIRYQWALNNTDKKYLFIIHDDIFFKNDIVSLYLSEITRLEKNDASPPFIVGDLGQCWRCPHADEGCTPSRILSGYRPSELWPLTKKNGIKNKWSCRVNEWSALIAVDLAKHILTKDDVYFGNYDDDGDIAAYWFSRGVSAGFSFSDPLPVKEMRDHFYLHGEDGYTGHSAWVDQGNGVNIYSPAAFKDKLAREFSYIVK